MADFKVTFSIEKADELLEALKQLASAIMLAKDTELKQVTAAEPVMATITPATVPDVSATPTPVEIPNAVTPEPVKKDEPTDAPKEAVPIDMDTVVAKCIQLMDAGKQSQLSETLGRYGVMAIPQLKPDQLSDFYNDIIKLEVQ